ncbi:MAG TPA: response regulator [Polyangiaceae bacterium]|nr:response regulator [Polyangiaceae bacterium]
MLLVDDDPTLLKLNRVRLEDAGYVVDTAANADDAMARAAAHCPALIVSDVLMGDVDGFGLCRKVHQDPQLARVPIVLLSSHCENDDSELAQRLGAAELLVRTADFATELEVIRSVLAERCVPVPKLPDEAAYERLLRRNANQISRLLGQAQNAENRYRTLFALANDAIALLTPDGVIIEANERWEKLVGIPACELVGRRLGDFVARESPLNGEALAHALASCETRSHAVLVRVADGASVVLEFSFSNVDVAGQRVVMSIGRDVTEEVAARRALTAAEERHRTLLERIPDVVWTARTDGRMVFATPNLAALLGRSLEDYGNSTLEERVQWLHPDDRARVGEALRTFGASGQPFDLEYRLRHADGRWIWVRNRSTARYERDGVDYVEGMLSDITERKVLEESLRQAQKMEAIGQLTGGIAHDFNNILAAILANSHFLLEALDAADPRRADAEEVRIAAERGAALTRQLLAFSRRQVLTPAIVDLNHAVAGIQKMLGRLVGEDVSLVVVPGPDLGSVRVDVGQLEQVIMNLVVNARDAMPNGGKISIETSNVEIDDGHSSRRAELTPGHYVRLVVSDTGSGMDAETQRRLFEPFFTTKPLGKGTGLGLSTCYGIVKQSGGHIWVHSELGHGSAFEIYLPRVDDGAHAKPLTAPSARVRGSETILLVEDDARLRHAVTRMLEQQGYRVLIAANAIEARGAAQRHRGSLDLLLTDVVMPGESGPELARDVRARFDCKVLFMSGYTDHAALQSGALGAAQSFIQKPFAPDALAKKLREVLDG